MPVHTIALLAAVGLLCLATIRVVSVLYKYHGARVVTCPETDRPAGVALDVRRVLSTGMVAAPRLRLSSCSRWPERAGCGQECLSQVEAEPEGCLVAQPSCRNGTRTKVAYSAASPSATFNGRFRSRLSWPAARLSVDIGNNPGRTAAGGTGLREAGLFRLPHRQHLGARTPGISGRSFNGFAD